jgi:predicted extracellular nuclease
MKKILLQFLLSFIFFIGINKTGSSQVVISQVYGGGGNSGATLRNDFIELFNRGATPVSLAGWSLQYASATGTGNFGGTTTQITLLPSVILQPGQYYLVQEASAAAIGVPLPTPDLTDATPINMSGTAGKVALVNTITPLGCNGSSTICSPASLATILDLVGYGGANFYEGSGPTPAPSNTTSVFRINNGCTDNNSNNTDFTAGTPNPRNTASTLNPCFAGLSITNTSPLAAGTVGSPYTVTFTASGGTGTGYTFSQTGGTLPPGLNLVGAVLSGTPTTTAGSPFSFTIRVVDDGTTEATKVFSLTINPQPCNPPTASIAQIQGSDNSSPLAGTTQTTSGIVTGRRSNGFFMQSPDASADADPNTSEGIFVFTSSAPPVAAAVGNSVCVTGTVVEFIPSTDPNSPSQTEIVSPSVTVLSTGNPMPTPIIVTGDNTDPSGSLYQLEKFEGMRVQVNSMTVVAPTQGTITESSATSVSNGFFYGVITGVDRPFREPGIAQPDPLPLGAPATITRWDANPELIGVGSSSIGGTAINVATGAILTNVVGPLDFRSRAYTIDIDPAIPPVVTNNGLTFTAVPDQTNDELTVASFNIERFYDDINDPIVSDVALTTTAYNNRLNKVSLAIRNVLRSPDVIGVVEVEKLSVLQAIAAKVNADAVAAGDPNPNYVAYLEEGNDVGGIDVGFLVKSARVNVFDVTQYGKTAAFINPNNGQPELLNDRPPLVLNGSFNKPGCAKAYSFTVIVNHLRSLNGVDDPADGNRVRTKRNAQAEYLANLIQGFQAADPLANILFVGDFNAFQFNDGYVDLIGTIKGTPTPASDVVLASSDLVNPDLTDLVDTYTMNQRYSYSFEGSAQVLDHILVNQNTLNKISRFSIARLDADFPEIYRNDATRPERISDHDAPVAYILFTDVTPPSASCKPVTITLSNGSATITPADIDNGSTDECGDVTLSVSKAQFDCSDIGENTVTLTVTDATGNTSSCTAVVTVVGEIPACSITAIPDNAIYTGGIPTNIYLGYGPQTVTLAVNATGGAPFTYSWSGAAGLSCTSCNNPTFTPTVQGTYLFNVTVTNTYGCTTTCSITICVLDIRVPGTNGKKVYLCHAPPDNPANTQSLAVNVNAVITHLADHTGDKLGQCGQDPCNTLLSRSGTGNSTSVSDLIKQHLSITVLPNPSRNYFTLSIEAKKDTEIRCRIFDINGRLINQKSGITPNAVFRTGSELDAGVYFAEVIQGNEKKVVKLIKL